MPDVPLVDASVAGLAQTVEKVKRDEGLDYRQLEAEVRSLENSNREDEQRQGFRLYTVVLATFIILIFLIVYIHVIWNVSELAESKAHPEMVIALLISPVAAITTLTVSLLIGAFKNRGERDASAVEPIIRAGQSVMGGQSN